jgi:hypothetical protein
MKKNFQNSYINETGWGLYYNKGHRQNSNTFVILVQNSRGLQYK